MTNSARRRINSAERLSSFREREEQRKEEQSRNPGKLFVIHPYGIGHKPFGKADRICSPETGTRPWHLLPSFGEEIVQALLKLSNA